MDKWTLMTLNYLGRNEPHDRRLRVLDQDQALSLISTGARYTTFQRNPKELSIVQRFPTIGGGEILVSQHVGGFPLEIKYADEPA